MGFFLLSIRMKPWASARDRSLGEGCFDSGRENILPASMQRGRGLTLNRESWKSVGLWQI